MKKIVLFALGLVAVATAHAQDEKAKVETTVAADFVTNYIWRGLDCGNISVQPTLGIGYKGLSLSAWGSVGFTSTDTKEFDLTLAYSIGGFNIGVTDYWFNAGLDPLNRYFKYAADCTNHVFEANVGYDFGFLSLQWYTNFAGNDLVEATGKLAYSSYFEINVPFTLGDVDWTATAGAVPFATDFYGTEGFAVTNLALTAAKEFQVTDTFSIPAFAQVAANPSARTAFLVFGISLQL